MADDDKPAPRPKMTLAEQAAFVGGICNGFRRHEDQRLWGEVFKTFSRDDMLKLEAVWQTLSFMDLHRADLLVRDKIGRERSRRD